MYLNIDRLGQPVELLPYIKPYFILALLGLLPMTIFNVLAQCSYGMKASTMPMCIILIANVLNVVGNFMLIYGHFGAPELGLFGAGISTLFSRIFTAICICLIFIYSKQFREISHYIRQSSWNFIEQKLIFTKSLPISLQMLFETAAFSCAAIFAGWMGKIELAAFQVMMSVGTLGFCFYYSLGSATSVLVANAAGRNDMHAMRRIGFAGYHLTLILCLLASAAFVLLGRNLVGLFTPDSEVITMCLTLILPLICYQLGDATQVNFANALRGTASVMPMLWIAFFSYIIVGLPASYIITFTFDGGIIGLFYSFSVSLFLAGILFFSFFLNYTKSRE
jgi:MATE family multidrug resistance protein